MLLRAFQESIYFSLFESQPTFKKKNPSQIFLLYLWCQSLIVYGSLSDFISNSNELVISLDFKASNLAGMSEIIHKISILGSININKFLSIFYNIIVILWQFKSVIFC